MAQLRNTPATAKDYESARPPRFRVGDMVRHPLTLEAVPITMVLYNPDCWDGWQYWISGCGADSFARAGGVRYE